MDANIKMSDSPPPSTVDSIQLENELKQKTMNLSLGEGAMAGVSIYAADQYIIPFALMMQASTFQIGILNAAVGVVTPTMQILGSHLLEKHTRRNILVHGVILQILMFPILILLGFFFTNQINLKMLPILPILLICLHLLYLSFGSVAGPSWFSTMGDIVPAGQRGRYFAKRNIIVTGPPMVIILLLSYMLDYYVAIGTIMIGFLIIYLIAIGARTGSVYLLTKHYYPPMKIEKSEYLRLRDFLRQLFSTNFGKFTLFVALINFGQMIAGPFFSVYMLTELNFNYSTFILVNLSMSFMSLLVFSSLGKYGDQFGNVRLLRIGACILPFLPIMWLFLDTPVGLIFGPQLFSAIGWTAFNLAASNFIYDNSTSHQRGYYVAYYNFVVGIGILTGGLLGSFIITIVPADFMDSFKFLFLLSGIVRGLVVVIFLPLIKETRKDILDHPIEERKRHGPIINYRQSTIHRGWTFEFWPRLKHRQNHNNNHSTNHNSDTLK